MFRQEDIDRLLEQLNIVDVVGEFVELKKSGANYKGLCPFHADNNPSFSVNPQKNICKCFVCGGGGNPISFYSKYKKISFQDSVRELAKKYHIPLQEIKQNKEENEKFERYYSIMEEAHQYFTNLIFENVGREALEYLAKRKVGPKLIRENNLGYASSSWDQLFNHLIERGCKAEELELLGLVKKRENGQYYDVFRNRVMFPIYSIQGRVIAFGGRTLEQSKEIPKYINSPDTPIFKKGKGLYGLERVSSIKQKDYAMMMEGYMDVLSTVSYGFDTSIAPLGTALTREQVRLLKRYTDNVILSFDSDNAGQMAAERAIFLLKEESFNIRVLQLHGAKDPDEFLKKFGREAFLKEVQECLEAFDFLYAYYKKEYSLDDIMSKQKFIERFQEFFHSLSKELEQELYLQKFSDLLGMDIQVLRPLLFPKGRKISFHSGQETVAEEINSQHEQEVYSVLEKLSIQISILDLQQHKEATDAKYYHFLKEMPFQSEFTRKIFQDLSQYEKDKEEQSRNTMIENIREMFQKENYNTEEKEYLFALLSECLEQEKIEEQKIIVCRDWARETFKNTMTTNPFKQLQLKQLEQKMLKNKKDMGQFLEMYQQYLKLREEK